MTHSKIWRVDGCGMQGEIREKQAVIRSKEESLARLHRDMHFWRQKFNAAEERAQREVSAEK